MSKPKRRHVAIEFEGEREQTAKPTCVTVPFAKVALLPIPEDNCAIATTRIESGTYITHDGQTFQIKFSILEGHRFAAKPIAKGEHLNSWGMIFGLAITNIDIGDYVINDVCLSSIASRKGLNLTLPSLPNFENVYNASVKLPKDFKPISLLPQHKEQIYWEGFQRPDNRGVGARNFVVLIGLTTRVGGFTKVLEKHLKTRIKMDAFPNIDGIISVSHTEGGSEFPINNLDLLLRTMAGFYVHPNIGAVLFVDSAMAGPSTMSLKTFQDYLQQNNFPTQNILSSFYEATGNFNLDLETCTETVTNWLPEVNKYTRTPVPLSELRIALQCGGSDAFSGISGNPLSGLVAKEVIQYGGSGLLAETDELIGAELWILKGCESEKVARHFLSTVDRFRDWAELHGHSPEGNPSGGNKLRGLYNIALKSLGAAMKKPADVPLEGVLEYGERFGDKSGYYFMDSPGNDLESIAGQVATGCQLIFFITGNGSITNFPFVPTIKIVTTTQRFKLLEHDMDFNAGRYLEGTPLPDLSKELFDMTVEVIKGKLTVGEKARHSQVSIWRNWSLSPEDLRAQQLYQAFPTEFQKPCLSLQTAKPTSDTIIEPKIPSVGLILPTSICSSPISSIIAERLNKIIQEDPTAYPKFSRFVALPHTEGCGSSGGSEEAIFARTMLHHLASPVVQQAVCLEHGCEKTHNDYMFNFLERETNIDPAHFGWASVQLDGGIESVSLKVLKMFHDLGEKEPLQHPKTMKIAFLTPPNKTVSNRVASLAAELATNVVSHKGMTFLPQNSFLTQHPLFLGQALDLGSLNTPDPTLGYGQRTNEESGLHFMQTFTDNWVETLSGLGATGISVAVAFVEAANANQFYPSHPMLPLLRIVNPEGAKKGTNFDEDFDFVISEDSTAEQLWELMVKTYQGHYEPKWSHHVDFQVTRGYLGISL